MESSKLKICFLAGTLGQGGAERQLFYMARALKRSGADVRIYCPYRGEYYESLLQADNIPVMWLGKGSSSFARLTRFLLSLFQFRPHVIEAAHFHMNLPTNLAGRLLGAVAIASSRSDLEHEIQACRPWGIWGIRTATNILANSNASKAAAIRVGVSPQKITVLSNVIDLDEFDRMSSVQIQPIAPTATILAVAVGTLCENKGFEHFIRALASARAEQANLYGCLAGDGPDRDRLLALVRSAGLVGGGFSFLGRRTDVPAVLRQASMLVLSSRVEGFPNVLLEAMAARVPIITTPAGDAAELVRAAQAGMVVEHADVARIAQCLQELAKSTELRRRLGENGRRYVARYHSATHLGETLLATYRFFAARQNVGRVLALRPLQLANRTGSA